VCRCDERLKPKTNLSTSESQDRGYGKDVDVYDTLIQSDTLEGYVRGKTVTRSVGVGRLKKPEDLSEISLFLSSLREKSVVFIIIIMNR
jgi:hypothetical protein